MKASEINHVHACWVRYQEARDDTLLYVALSRKGLLDKDIEVVLFDAKFRLEANYDLLVGYGVDMGQEASPAQIIDFARGFLK